MDKNDVIAIDFGTSRTKLAYFDPQTDRVELMAHKDNENKVYLPTYFAVNTEEEIIFGRAAQDMFESTDRKEKKRAVNNIKGEIDAVKTINVGPGRRKKVQELLTAAFTFLRKKAAELDTFESEPRTVYLTHPTTWSMVTRDEILKPCAMDAGFSSVELIAEPMAACIWAANSEGGLPPAFILLDCGAGTLHWAFMQLSSTHSDNSQLVKYIMQSGERDILNPGGTNTVGGKNVDEDLRESLEKRENEDEKGVKITVDERAFLSHEAMIRKEGFSRNEDYEPPGIQIENLVVDSWTKQQIKSAIKNKYITPACEAIKPYIEDVTKELKRLGRKPPALILTGGCSELKGFKQALKEEFELENECIVIDEFATVRGAMLLARAQTSDTIDSDTIDSDTIKSKSEGGCAGIILLLGSSLLGSILLCLFILFTM